MSLVPPPAIIDVIAWNVVLLIADVDVDVPCSDVFSSQCLPLASPLVFVLPRHACLALSRTALWCVVLVAVSPRAVKLLSIMYTKCLCINPLLSGAAIVSKLLKLKKSTHITLELLHITCVEISLNWQAACINTMRHYQFLPC